jgi:hypothetical protein
MAKAGTTITRVLQCLEVKNPGKPSHYHNSAQLLENIGCDAIAVADEVPSAGGPWRIHGVADDNVTET